MMEPKHLKAKLMEHELLELKVLIDLELFGPKLHKSSCVEHEILDLNIKLLIFENSKNWN